jgi:hypothetical protein
MMIARTKKKQTSGLTLLHEQKIHYQKNFHDDGEKFFSESFSFVPNKLVSLSSCIMIPFFPICHKIYRTSLQTYQKIVALKVTENLLCKVGEDKHNLKLSAFRKKQFQGIIFNLKSKLNQSSSAFLKDFLCKYLNFNYNSGIFESIFQQSPSGEYN